MKLRHGQAQLVLMSAAVLSMLSFAWLAGPDLGAVGTVVSEGVRPQDWPGLGLASLVMLLGHVLRAARTKVPIDNVRKGPLVTQFQSLGVGYVFDILLPLRLGEIVRSFLVAKKLRISFLYTLLAVILERLIDVILVASAFLGFSLVLNTRAGPGVSVAALGVVLFSFALIGLFVLLVRENNTILRFAWRISSWLNADLANRMRFKIWSVIFGFQRFFRDSRQLGRYALLAVASWACYLAAAMLAALTIFPALGRTAVILASVTPYAVVSPSIASGAPGPYVKGVAAALGGVDALAADLAVFAAASWAILNVPIFLAGLVSLFLIDIRRIKPALVAPEEREGSVHRLIREHDISQDFPAFLDSYFRRQELSRVLHKMEVAGNISLVRFFKGSSNAVTLLAVANDELYVKKMVPPQYAERLKNQYDWLAERDSMSQLVSVLREERADDYYSIDLEYRPNVPLFEYIHELPLAEAEKVLSQVWSYMYSEIYRTDPVRRHPEERDVYVSERLLDRVHAAAESHEDLGMAIRGDRIVVNGRTLDNFGLVMSRVRNHETAWNDLAMYRSSQSIHGDLTVDNILVELSTGKPLLIDPSDDNQVRGPLIDFARQMQSLQFGYEFLNLDEQPVLLRFPEEGLPQIVFRDSRSARYARLADFVETQIMAKHLAPQEQRSILFHVGLFFGRMLTHRVVINPDTALKYYAVCILALNRFLDQYELPRR